MWVLGGFRVGSVWVPCGFHVGSGWVPGGFQVLSRWVLNRFGVGSKWVLGVSKGSFVWVSCSFCVGSNCVFGVFFVGSGQRWKKMHAAHAPHELIFHNCAFLSSFFMRFLCVFSLFLCNFGHFC